MTTRIRNKYEDTSHSENVSLNVIYNLFIFLNGLELAEPNKVGDYDLIYWKDYVRRHG
jgi:hypothetical protein